MRSLCLRLPGDAWLDVALYLGSNVLTHVNRYLRALMYGRNHVALRIHVLMCPKWLRGDWVHRMPEWEHVRSLVCPSVYAKPGEAVPETGMRCMSQLRSVAFGLNACSAGPLAQLPRPECIADVKLDVVRSPPTFVTLLSSFTGVGRLDLRLHDLSSITDTVTLLIESPPPLLYDLRLDLLIDCECARTGHVVAPQMRRFAQAPILTQLTSLRLARACWNRWLPPPLQIPLCLGPEARLRTLCLQHFTVTSEARPPSSLRIATLQYVPGLHDGWLGAARNLRELHLMLLCDVEYCADTLQSLCTGLAIPGPRLRSLSLYLGPRRRVHAAPVLNAAFGAATCASYLRAVFLICTGLEDFRFSSEGLDWGDAGAACLADALPVLSPDALRRLCVSLRSANIGNTGAAALVLQCAKRPVLQRLYIDLRNNCVRKISQKTFQLLLSVGVGGARSGTCIGLDCGGNPLHSTTLKGFCGVVAGVGPGSVIGSRCTVVHVRSLYCVLRTFRDTVVRNMDGAMDVLHQLVPSGQLLVGRFGSHIWGTFHADWEGHLSYDHPSLPLVNVA